MIRRTRLIRHAANIEDEATGRGYEAFRFAKLDGSRGEIEMAREDAYDPNTLLRELLKHNAGVPVDRKRARRQVRQAIDATPEEFRLRCGCTGWRDGVFVAPLGVIDPQDGRVARAVLLPPRSPNRARRPASPVGDLEAWGVVAEICGGSDLGQTLLCAALAATLLELMGRASFGVHVAAATGVGVEELLAAAASVSHAPGFGGALGWRDGEEEAERCRLHNDLILPLDLGALPEKEFYAAFRSAVIAVLDARRDSPFGLSGFEASGQGGRCRTIFLSFAPHPIHRYARLAGRRRDPREHEACLHAIAVRNGPTVLDRPDPDRSDRESLIALREACSANYGVAIGPFVRFLMQDIGRSKQRIDQYAETFLRQNHEDRGFDAFDRTMANIALIYAAGCMGVDAGILPYDKDELSSAVRDCLNGSVTSLACITHPDNFAPWPD